MPTFNPGTGLPCHDWLVMAIVLHDGTKKTLIFGSIHQLGQDLTRYVCAVGRVGNQ